MATTLFDFSNPSNYTLSNISIASAIASIAANTPLTKTSNFGTPADYTYNASLIQVASNQATLSDQGPSNGCTFFASMASTANADFSSGSPTATLAGAATVAGGFLKLVGAGATAKWPGALNQPIVQSGTLRFIVQPQYSGAPATHQILHTSNVAGAVTNLIQIYHAAGTGVLHLIVNSTVSTIFDASAAWSPVSGTSYEIEADIDVTGGTSRLFINGVLLITGSGTGTRSSSGNQIAFGIDSNNATYTTNFWIKNFAMFPAVQHTAGYTAPSAVPTQQSYSTASPTITLAPGQAISDADLSAITDIDVTASTPSGSSISYVVSLDGGSTNQYWNGSAWATSSGVGQSNPIATLVAHLATLSLGTTFQLVAFLTSTGATTPALSEVIVTYTGRVYDSGTILSNSGFTAQELTNFVADLSETGSDTVKFAFKVNSTLKYWSGSAWVTSNGSAAQANTAATILANLTSLLSVNSTVYIYAILTSAAGDTTPTLTTIAITYDFGAIEGPVPATCIVFGFLYDIEGLPVQDAIVKFEIFSSEIGGFLNTDDHLIEPSKVTITTDANGYFEHPILQSPQVLETTLVTQVTITKAGHKKMGPLAIIVPDAFSYDLTGLISL